MKLLCLFSVFAAGAVLAQAPADPAAVARKGLDLLLSEKYADLFQMFSPELQSPTAIPQEALVKIGTSQVKPLGAPTSIAEPAVRKAGNNSVVTISVKFPARSMNFIFAVNSAGQIYIMNIQPGEMSWQRPPYSKPDAFHERAVTFGDEWKLPGTLTEPVGNGPFPAVVLVHGSGPNDRDETVGAAKVFKDLAEGLASRGIAVLRYEKRTRLYGARMAGKSGLTIQEETVDDAVSAASLLRSQKEIDSKKIYVLGHSLGGYAAPRIAEDDGKLAGIILLAANARPLEDLILEQAQYLGMPAKDIEKLKAQSARIKSLEPADSDAPPILGMPVPYLLDLKGYDPAADAKKLTIPILVLQGERDFQATMKDFALWKAVLGSRKDVTFHSYPALNHLFVAGEGKSTEAEYNKPGHVAPEVVDDIAKWIK